MLNPRAIAVAGVGFASLVFALQGFAPTGAVTPPVEPTPIVITVPGGYDSVGQRTSVYAARNDTSHRITAYDAVVDRSHITDPRDVDDIADILCAFMELEHA
jgi:hypothetical protein